MLYLKDECYGLFSGRPPAPNCSYTSTIAARGRGAMFRGSFRISASVLEKTFSGHRRLHSALSSAHNNICADFDGSRSQQVGRRAPCTALPQKCVVGEFSPCNRKLVALLLDHSAIGDAKNSTGKFIQQSIIMRGDKDRRTLFLIQSPQQKHNFICSSRI